MLDIVRSLLGALRATVRTHRALALENLAIRHQLTVLQRRTQGRTRLRPADRLLWVWLARSWRAWRQHLTLVKPETVVRWSRQRFRTYWAWKPDRARRDDGGARVASCGVADPRCGDGRWQYQLFAG
jgi:hypothetical protein